jgi:hypothetical protein
VAIVLAGRPAGLRVLCPVRKLEFVLDRSHLQACSKWPMARRRMDQYWRKKKKKKIETSKAWRVVAWHASCCI